MTNLVGEFFGTMVLMSFGCGCVANAILKKSKAEGAGWVAITGGWGFAVIMGVFCAVSAGAPQADLNPAVTLAKMLVGVYTVPQALATMLAELLGGIAGGVVAWLVFLPHWEVTEDQGAKLAIFCTAPAIRNPATNVLCEVIATIMLIVPIFAIFSKQVGGLAPGFGPYLVGILVWAIGLSFGGPTGYAINPARDLGPRIAHAILPIAGKGGSDWGYAWVPVIAPLIGAVCAFFIASGIGMI